MAEQVEKASKPQTRAVQGFDCEKLLSAVGSRIRLRRQQLDMSQPDLAKKLQIAANSVSQYETGVVDFSICRLAQIAEALETTTEALLNDVVKPAPSLHLLDNMIIKQTMIEAMREFEKERRAMVEAIMPGYGWLVGSHPCDMDLPRRAAEAAEQSLAQKK